jgi:hypothetical protein
MLLMLACFLALGVAGCGDNGPETDLGGDTGGDAQAEVTPADNGGEDDGGRDTHGDVPPEIRGDAASDTSDNGTPDDLMDDETTPGDIPADGDSGTAVDSADAPDTHDTADTAEMADTQEDVDDIQTPDVPSDIAQPDTVDDIRDITETDTSEPAAMIPVFAGYSAAAGSMVSQDYGLGFTMGAGRFEFSAAGGDYILGPSMCVAK